MKKTIFTGLFIFSLALNLAVAATLGWHLWTEGPSGLAVMTQAAPLNKEALSDIRQVMSSQDRSALVETRRKIIEKNMELLDMIAKDPGDLRHAEPVILELNALKAQMERQALTRISTVMASLPQDKRQAFAEFLKNRTCMMRGMPMGRGGRHGRGGGMGPCPMAE